MYMKNNNKYIIKCDDFGISIVFLLHVWPHKFRLFLLHFSLSISVNICLIYLFWPLSAFTLGYLKYIQKIYEFDISRKIFLNLISSLCQIMQLLVKEPLILSLRFIIMKATKKYKYCL